MKSSSVYRYAQEIFSLAKSGCEAFTASSLMFVFGYTIEHVEFVSSTSLLANFSVFSIIEHVPLDFVVSCSSCIIRSASRAWTNLMLATVFSGSVVAVTKSDYHKDMSIESTMKGWCTPSSSQSARTTVSLSWINLCSSRRSIAESVV